MALIYSGVRVELREVKLTNIPADMLHKSPKATVPVLVLGDGKVIDESLDVMHWSLSQSDPQHWLDMDAASLQLIQRSDRDFKPLLDRYKYADRHPQHSQLEHRQLAQVFLAELNGLLASRTFLSGDNCRLVDVAIFPFVRQFAGVDATWFESCEYAALRQWLNTMLAAELFQRVMRKHPFWQPGDVTVYL